MAERAQKEQSILIEDDTLITRSDNTEQDSPSSQVNIENTIEVDDQLLARLDEDVALGTASAEAYTTAVILDETEEERIMSIGLVRFRGYLTLTEQQTGIKIKIDSDKIENAIIGRLNRLTGIRPTIDLTDFIKPRDGVSRHHAIISKRGELLTVTDYGSRNGTFLNGQRIIAKQSRILRDGDFLRVGRIVLRVSFDHLEAEREEEPSASST